MKKPKNSTLVKIEITIAIIIILAGFLTFFSHYSVTGFVSAESKIQSLDLVIAKSQNFILTSDNEEPYTLTSFKISGEVSGDGLAEVYITDSTGQKVLVYENIGKVTKTMSAITGMVPAVKRNLLYEKSDSLLLIIPDKELETTPKRTLEENEVIKTGAFNDACKESCFIKMEMSRNNEYNLIVEVEPGTTVNINQITITYAYD